MGEVKMKRWVRQMGGVLLAAVLMGSGPASGRELSETLKTLRDSVVAVGTLEEGRSPRFEFLGTGFAVGDGSYVVTNEHVPPAVPDFEHFEKVAVLTGTGQATRAHAAEVVAMDHEHDLVLLKVEGLALKPLHFGDSSQAEEGDALAFTGFPLGTILGIYPVTHRATLSCITPIVIPVVESKDLSVKSILQLRKTPFDVFQLDGTAYPGNSGSPLYDPSTGRVMGIVNMVFIKSTKEKALSEPSGIAYAIPGKYIVDLLVKAGVKP